MLSSKPEGSAKQERYVIVPLRAIPEHWDEIHALLPKDSEDVTVEAFRQTILLLSGLYHMSHPSWLAVRDRVCVGFVKETKNYGNTSVSMGLAKLYFDRYPESDLVGFLNCGTGGIKFQKYTKNDSIIAVGTEHKPGKKGSPNLLSICGFKPNTGEEAPKTTEDLRAEMETELNIFEEKSGVKGSFGFVTGMIRADWEKRKGASKDELNAQMCKYMRVAGPDGEIPRVAPVSLLAETKQDETFFIAQDGEFSEGSCELIGILRLYEQLAAASLIPNDARVIASWGIGQGSCQKVFRHPTEKRGFAYNHPFGMKTRAGLETMGVEGILSFAKHIGEIIEYVSACTSPVIALKSGGLLHYEANKGLQSFLTTLSVKTK